MQKVLSKREKIILYATVSVIVLSVGFNFIIAPVLTQNDNLNKEISITKARLQKYMRLLGHKDAIQNKYGRYAQGLQPADAQAGTLAGALAELDNLAKGSGITIVDIRPQGPTGANRGITVELRAEGDMDGFLKFIYTIENSLSLFDIRRLQLTYKPNTQVLEGTFLIVQLFL
jgi:hypothetical protein